MIQVRDAHFEFLRLQKGSLDRYSHDRELWQRKYEADLLATYDEIKPHLPARCWGFLDIGSGLGGIDVLIYRHYVTHGQRFPYVNLLDGENDAPEMRLHRQTFNSMKVAKDFLTLNGVDASRFGYYTPTAHNLPKPYDLVVSFGSWCFHYEPATYLPLLLKGAGLHEDSVVIVDLRKAKNEWVAQLRKAGFRLHATVRESRKFDRVVFHRS